MARLTVQNAKNRYQALLETPLPKNNKRDLVPTKSSLIGCMSLKFALVFVVAIMLTLYSMWLNNFENISASLNFETLLLNFSVGWGGVYFLLTIFTEFYVRVKSGIFGLLAFVVLASLIVGIFCLWLQLLHVSSLTLTIVCFIVIIIGLLCLAWDVANLFNFSKNASKKRK